MDPLEGLVRPEDAQDHALIAALPAQEGGLDGGLGAESQGLEGGAELRRTKRRLQDPARARSAASRGRGPQDAPQGLEGLR